MALVSDLSLCLGKVEYSETSQVLTLFSRGHGIVKVLAKGAHRRTKAGASRFDGGVDLLDLGAATFTDDARRDLATLTEWKLISGHLELRQNLRGLRLALYSAELVGLLIEARDPHPELFDRLAGTIPDLATDRAEAAMLAWELDLLKLSGYLPELFICIACQSRQVGNERERVFFSPSRAGVICHDCHAAVPDRISLDARLLRVAQSILRLPRINGIAQRLPHLTRLQTDPLNRILAEYLAYTLGKRLRTARYVTARERNSSDAP